MYDRKASITLRFVVVGGSIAGLATAYALRKAGHGVIVLEQSDGKRRSHGSIRSPPNMTRLLNKWGFGPFLAKVGMGCSAITFKEGDTGAVIGSVALLEPFFNDLLADFWLIEHGDLHSMLYEKALETGVEIQFNSKVTKVDIQSISVTLESGETYEGDIILGADGPKSVVRSSVLSQKPAETTAKHLYLTVTVPTKLLREDEDFLSLIEEPEWTIWLGDRFYAHGSLGGRRSEFSITAYVPFDGDLSAFDNHWKDHYPLDHFNLDLERFEPRIRKLFELAEYVTPTLHSVRSPLESLVCERGRTGVVGDAAHPLMPNAFHGAAMAIEDAVTLGNLFSHINHTDQISRILVAYEEIRQPHCIRTHALDGKKHLSYIVQGPAQKARDRVLQQALAKPLSEWDDEAEKELKERWSEEVDLFAHDANEKVEDWWTKWGALLERESASGMPLSRRLEVSVLEAR